MGIWAISQFLAFKIGRDEMKGGFIDMKGDGRRMYGFMCMANQEPGTSWDLSWSERNVLLRMKM